MDEKTYCKGCTKIILISDDGNSKFEEDKNQSDGEEKKLKMIVCFHCELLTNKSNRSVVKRFTNKLQDKANTYGKDQGKYADEENEMHFPGDNVIEHERSDSDIDPSDAMDNNNKFDMNNQANQQTFLQVNPVEV